MKGTQYRICTLFVLAGALLSGCNLPWNAPDLKATQFAATLAAELTQKAPTRTPVYTKTPRPTPTSTLPPTNTLPPPTLPPTATPETIFWDDFSNSRGWPSAESTSWAFGIASGDYFIFVNFPNGAIWSVRYEAYADVKLQTHAVRIEGPESGYYGVVCRHVDASNYYMFVVGEDGFFGIGKMFAGSLSFIDKGTDDAGIIHRGQVANQVEGDCLGSTLSLVVNGQTLLSVQDSTHQAGNIGLAAGAFSAYGLRVQFSDFAILKP